MTDTLAIQQVLDGYRADIARRTALIRDHATAAEQLAADNAIDTKHAAIAIELIGLIRANETAVWNIPAGDIQAAALITNSSILIGGMPSVGKAFTPRLAALAALLDAEADITAADGTAAVHLHDHAADDCPACLLLGSGDLAVLDGMNVQEVTR